MELIKKSEKMKVLKNVKMIIDVKKEEAFTNALEELLQVNLVSGIDPNNPIKIAAFWLSNKSTVYYLNYHINKIINYMLCFGYRE